MSTTDFTDSTKTYSLMSYLPHKFTIAIHKLSLNLSTFSYSHPTKLGLH